MRFCKGALLFKQNLGTINPRTVVGESYLRNWVFYNELMTQNSKRANLYSDSQVVSLTTGRSIERRKLK